MFRKFVVLGTCITLVMIFSFSMEPGSNAHKIEQEYYRQLAALEKQTKLLRALLQSNNTTQLRQQFLQTRKAYKTIEPIAGYFFGALATKLNGPPILFYEEDEPDRGQQTPSGLQVIESYIFPVYDRKNKAVLLQTIEQLLGDIDRLKNANQNYEFSDAFIIDAVMEELYRITAMGIAGFDSQLAMNALPETFAALASVEKILDIYKNDIAVKIGEKKRTELQHLLSQSKAYCLLHNNFDGFDRMLFIRRYLDPITVLTGEFKKASGFADNNFPLFYSLVKKDNSLFAAGNFDPNKFLDDNSTSFDKVEMGRKLFFDTRLSSDNKRSCASCHNPAKAFTDRLSTSVALDGHTSLPRNAPTIWNAALQRTFFWDNRSGSLEEQVLQVLNNEREMNSNAQATVEKIIEQQAYKLIYDRAYPKAPKADAAKNIANAIACYERTMIAMNSRFDRQMRGEQTMNRNEVNGFNLFMGKAKCGTCHFVPLFSGAKPPRFYYLESEVLGIPKENVKENAVLDDDEGRYAITKVPIHQFAFKTPGLRNVALTAPYMHNGVFKTLEEVIDFYDNGGGQGLHIAPKNQTLPFDKLKLAKHEKSDIILFLKTLTDTTLQN